MSGYIHVRRLLGVLVTTEYQNTRRDEPNKLNDHQSQDDARDINEPISNHLAYFSVTSAHKITISLSWYRRRGCAVCQSWSWFLCEGVDQMVVVLWVHDEIGAAWLRHIADSVFGVLVPPGLLPVGVVELAAALELVLDEVEVLGHARVVGLAVGFEQVVEDVANVDVGVVAVEEDERDAGYFEA